MAIVGSQFSKWQLQSHLHGWAPPNAPQLNKLFSASVAYAENNQGISSRICGLFAATVSFVNGAGYLLRLCGRVSFFVLSFKGDVEACRQDVRYAMHSLFFTAAMTFVVFASIFLPHLFNLKNSRPKELVPIQPVAPQRAYIVPEWVINYLTHIVKEQTLRSNELPSSGNWVPLATEAKPQNIFLINPQLLRNLHPLLLRAPDAPLLLMPPPSELSHPWETISTEELIESLKNSKKEGAKSFSEMLQEIYRTWLTRPNDITKDMKYRESLNLMSKAFEEKFGKIETVLRKISNDHPLYAALYYISSSEDYRDVREQYAQFILHLRQAVQDNKEPSDSENTKMIQFLCYLRWSQIPLYAYTEELMNLANPNLPNSTKELALNNLWNCVKEANSTLANPENPNLVINPFDRGAQKAKGYFNYNFDPTLGPNIPSQAFSCGKVTFLRHATPTEQKDAIHNFLSRALQKIFGITIFTQNNTAVVADYRGFLSYLRQEKKKILHCILEKKEPQVWGDESGRVFTRIALEKEFPKTFTALALSVDNSLFKREDKYTNTLSFEALKTALLEEMQNPNSTHYYIPDRFSQRERLTSLFQEVHSLFFQGQEKIPSTETYKAYILLCYAHLMLSIIKEDGIDFAEAICKDDIDRGNAFKAILYLYILLLSGKENEADSLQKIVYSLIGAPFIVKKQGVMPNRLDFLKYVINVFQTLSEEQKKTIREKSSLGTFFQIGLEIKKIEGQHIYPTVQSAGNLREYNAYLKHFLASDPWALSCGQDLIEVNANCYRLPESNLIDPDKIFKQIARDIAGKVVYRIGDTAASVGPQQIKEYLLKEGLSEQEALRVMCSCQQGTTADLLTELHKLFDHEKLKIQVADDKSQDASFNLSFSIGAKNGVASVQASFLARICQEKNGDPQGTTLCRLGCLIVIGDTTRPKETTVFRWIVRD